MLLNEIKTKLEEIDPRVYYGMVDRSIRETEWNYIVFNRQPLRITGNGTGYSDYFDVHIIREDYIPEGLYEQVIAKLSEINGVRITGETHDYEYVQKPNTNTVVEMLTLHFVRARKNV